MGNFSFIKVYTEVVSGWRGFASGIVTALDSYSPLPVDLAGWADPERQNTPAEEEMIDEFERDLIRENEV